MLEDVAEDLPENEPEALEADPPSPDAADDEAIADAPPSEEDNDAPEGTENADDGDAQEAPDGEDGPDDDDVGDEEEEEGEDASGEENGSALPLGAVVEAVLFAAREPLKAVQIARAVGKRTRQEAVRDAIAELNVQYLETGRAFEVAEISGRYQLMSRPEYAVHIMRIYPKKELAEKEKSHRLTPVALDTLAIIAYKQPVTRADIEHIRGVGCGTVIKTLVERGSVKPVGKRTDLIGQPLVYGTTEAFLAEFGLGTLDELPLRNEFIGMLGSEGAEVEYSQPEEPAAEAGDDQPQSSETPPVEADQADTEEEDVDAADGNHDANDGDPLE